MRTCCFLSLSYIKPQHGGCAQFLISFLYQTTTRRVRTFPRITLFLISFLYQTTTLTYIKLPAYGCFLSLSYIKPQLFGVSSVAEFRCFLSLSYIKPQLRDNMGKYTICCFLSLSYIKPQPPQSCRRAAGVVSYLFPISNHNCHVDGLHGVHVVSYLFPISNHNPMVDAPLVKVLFLISFLYQTTTASGASVRARRCFLSLSYIKPQPKCNYVLYIKQLD